MIGRVFSRNEELLPIDKGVIPLDDVSFSYGFGVYETLKVRENVLFFPELHIERLLNSALLISLRHDFSAKNAQERLEKLVEANARIPCNIRVLLIRRENGADWYAFALSPFFVPRRAYREGISTLLVEGERPFPQAKTLGVLVSALAYRQAKERGAYDALLVDRERYVREGTRTNIFYSDGNTVFTPPATQVLDGVTRRTLMELLDKKGLRIVERPLKVEEIPDYAGFFLTSTSSNVLPISRIGEREVSIPPIVKVCMEEYREYMKRYADMKKSAPGGI